jgi:PHD/YefM family antitoxin component YafN of YafNO toxin-antitoxin module
MTQVREPEMVYRNGKPVAVILDIASYTELLERLEDMEDLRALNEMKKEPQEWVSLDELLEEFGRRTVARR